MMRSTPLLTMREDAERIGVSRSTVYKYMAERELRYVQLGPQLVRFDAESLVTWIRDRTISGS